MRQRTCVVIRFALLAGFGLLGARLVGAQGVVEEKPVRSGIGESWGTTNESYYRMAASHFTGMQFGVDDWGDRGYIVGGYNFARYSLIPNGYLLASPNLPSGALLTYLELDSCDTNDSNNVVLALFDCDYHGDCSSGPAVTLSSANNVTPNGCSYVGANIAFPILVNNYSRQLTLRVLTEAGDETTALSGVVIGYKLQVAPPPSVATFPDVPTSDFGFQFVEALAASGITGGCGGGLYCPDAPVTRRQMAIFIAKALGIYSPLH